MKTHGCDGELHIVLYSPDRAALRIFLGDLEAAGHRVVSMPGAARIRLDDLTIVLAHEKTIDGVVNRLEHEYAHLVLVDLRIRSDRASFETRASDVLQLLEHLDRRDDIESRYGFHRIVALVSDADGRRSDRVLLELGARGIRHILRDGADGGEPFPVRVLIEACRTIRSRAIKKTALCLSGGGITGIYFELGVLKCFSDCLPRGALNHLDMLFGISAGAVISSALASGYSVDEFMASIAGHDDTRMPRLNLRLVRLGHVDLRAAVRRSARALRSLWKWGFGLLRRPPADALDDLLLDYSDVVGPLFRSDKFEEMLRTVLSVPGTTNDFRQLPSELYIGSTDQDARRHVVFGAERFEHVPISKAAQASLSFPPAFPSVEIEGRYYEDGAVTRTSNFIEAIRRDASLVIIVDPFLPVVSKNPGAIRDRGLFYQVDQSLRTISYTRFENARDWVLRRYPEVSVYTFLPSNRQRHLLSVTPMDHRPFLELWRSAYVSTWHRLEHLRHRLAGDFKAHGLSFDLDRARYVGSHLEGRGHLEFADFYPDRQVEIPKPVFALHRREERAAEYDVPAA